MAAPLVIRELRDDERAWANDLYRSIEFATTPPGSPALVAERGGERIGLGRLVVHAAGVVELGGIWTDEAARGGGVARAMVTALLARPELAARGPGEPLWCIPFVHLAAFYQSCGFAPAAPPWPAAMPTRSPTAPRTRSRSSCSPGDGLPQRRRLARSGLTSIARSVIYFARRFPCCPLSLT